MDQWDDSLGELERGELGDLREGVVHRRIREPAANLAGKRGWVESAPGTDRRQHLTTVKLLDRASEGVASHRFTDGATACEQTDRSEERMRAVEYVELDPLVVGGVSDEARATELPKAGAPLHRRPR